MIRRCYVATACLTLFVLIKPSAGQIVDLEKALDKVQSSMPRWRAALSAVSVESLPVQYKEGKQVDYMKSASLEQLDRVEKAAGSLRKKVSATDAVQLLLDMHDAETLIQGLASTFMAVSMDDKSGSHAVDWSKSVLDTSVDIGAEEKEIEVPVMALAMARDALADACKDWLVPH